MELQVVCAQCGEEFKANGDEPKWPCTACGHEVDNIRYPFLTRRVAHAKANRSETDWEGMFDEVLAAAHEKVLALEVRLAKLEAENRKLKAKPPASQGSSSPAPERHRVK